MTHLPYEHLLSHVLSFGEDRPDRTGTGTRSLFAPAPLRYDLGGRKLALITSKQVAWRMALRELMWMLSGSTDVNELRKTSPQMADIWANWADENGDIGPTYGAQYRNAGGRFWSWDEGAGRQPINAGVDQLARVIEALTETPDTRRAVISLWGVSELDAMGIEPCMVLFQFSLRGSDLDQLHLHVYQRSADMMLGVPFDLFQASVLAHLVARELTFTSKRHIRATQLTWSAGDAHVYANHLEAAREQVDRLGERIPHVGARLTIPTDERLRLLDGSLTAAHISVDGYHSLAPISAGPIAV